MDRAVATAARAALARAGLRPGTVCGDGRDGFREAAPYDRVVATAGVREVPAAWLEQTRPGGRVLVPWGTHYSAGDALLRLTVAGDGSAAGPFLRPVEFMKLRAQRLDWGRFGGHVGRYPGDAAVSRTAVTLAELGAGRRFGSASFVLGLCVPDCAQVRNDGETGSTVWFFDTAPGSRAWAAAVFRADGGEVGATVYQAGPRRLWDEVARALEWWRGQGSPRVDAFGLTVTPDGAHRPWLGGPARPVPRFAA